jgi:hypothetical protein
MCGALGPCVSLRKVNDLTNSSEIHEGDISGSWVLSGVKHTLLFPLKLVMGRKFNLGGQ